LAAATDAKVTVQSVLQLLGAVEEEALFRLTDLVVDRDTPGLLAFVEELADQGQDLARLVTDLLEHLRHLLLVQHLGEVPESLPVTPETRDRLRSQANQLTEPEVLRLIDLLHVAVDDVRQGGDPRLPLELALVKVTRPGADLSRESTAYRLEQLESKLRGDPHRAVEARPAAPAEPAEAAAGEPEPDPAEGEGPHVGLPEIQAAWRQTILPAVSERSIPTSSVLSEAKPVALEGRRLVLEFPPAASFHRGLAEDPKNADVLAAVLHEHTGRRLELSFEVGEGPHEEAATAAEEPATEDEIISLMQTTFDARPIGKEGD
ncbi:MAG TPA: hypothetical protein VK915_04905, partial [Gaiellaceae bacterium]|nr:hypothetical protein [Gaiellaceae bacterium]